MTSTLSLSSTTVLLVVDVQRGFRDQTYWGGNRSTPELEENIEMLLARFRNAHLPVIHVKHNSTIPTSPLHPSNCGNEIEAYAQPLTTNGEVLLHKTVNSAFIGTDLEQRLRDLQASTVIIVGLTTNHCCETTARMAANLGFNVLFVRDATATFDRRFQGKVIGSTDLHFNTLMNLNEEFATIVTAQEIIDAIDQIQ